MPVKSYKDRNGKTKYYAAFYYSDYTGQRKKKKKEGFTTAAAAKQFEKDFTEQHSGSSDILFKNLVENYLADCAQRLKPSTLYGKKAVIKAHVLPYFSELSVSEIKPLHVRKWQNEILQKGFRPGKGNGTGTQYPRHLGGRIRQGGHSTPSPCHQDRGCIRERRRSAGSSGIRFTCEA